VHVVERKLTNTTLSGGLHRLLTTEERRHAMFQPFVRGEGLGLGLSLVQRICTEQDWQVQLTTREPNGCRFTVTLTQEEGGQSRGLPAA
jgi:K+-sensing histidine kinase KdpD